MWRNRNSHIASGTVKWCGCFGGQFGSSAKRKTWSDRPYDLAVPLVVIYTRAFEIYISTKTCAQMFTIALFTIAKKWGPNVQLMTVHTMECYLVRNEVLTHDTTWVSKTLC